MTRSCWCCCRLFNLQQVLPVLLLCIAASGVIHVTQVPWTRQESDWARRAQCLLTPWQ